jgi:hypothetical protein
MGNLCCFTLSCAVLPDEASEGEPIPLKAGLGGIDRDDGAACALSNLLLVLYFPPLELGRRPPTITALK